MTRDGHRSMDIEENKYRQFLSTVPCPHIAFRVYEDNEKWIYFEIIGKGN
jgi:hypothetical protein